MWYARPAHIVEHDLEPAVAGSIRLTWLLPDTGNPDLRL